MELVVDGICHFKGGDMSSASASAIDNSQTSRITPIQGRIDRETDGFLASLPLPAHLFPGQRREIITRYTAVLEGNFIYWMTGAYLAAKSDQARAIILDNLHEEVRDAHPAMLRTFAIAANAIPTDTDALAVHRNLTNVRLFVGRLSAVRILVMMAFFEGLLQRFMPYLAELAERQGSGEFVYTDVHGVCDVAHTQGLYRAIEAEMDLATDDVLSESEMYEGVALLRALLENIVTA
jgi:Iron-containing redox enzyme